MGIGVDVVHLPRMERLSRDDRLLQKICTPEERAHLPTTVAGRARAWATKEAVAKTLGTGFWQAGVEWTDVRLGPDWSVQLAGRALDVAGPSRFELEFLEEGDYLIVTAQRWSS